MRPFSLSGIIFFFLLTCFVYLADCPWGTDFPKLNITVTPRAGMAVIFCPARLPSAGSERDVRMVHAGVRIDGPGEKYICQMWGYPFPILPAERENLLSVHEPRSKCKVIVCSGTCSITYSYCRERWQCYLTSVSSGRQVCWYRGQR